MAFGGFKVGFAALSWSVLDSATDRIGTAIWSVAVSWIIGGVVIGIAQWLILRRITKGASWWALVSLLGWTIGGAINAVVMGAVGGSIMGRIVGFSMSGFVIGITQWLILRRLTRRAGWWILTNIVSWVIGGLVSEIMAWAGNWIVRWIVGGTIDIIFRGSASVVGNAVGNTVEGTIIGILTGGTLVWLLKNNWIT